MSGHEDGEMTVTGLHRLHDHRRDCEKDIKKCTGAIHLCDKLINLY